MKYYFLVWSFLILASIVSCKKQEKAIEGLKASSLYSVYQKQGFQLDSGETMMWRKLHRWQLTKENTTITILGDANHQIFEVDVNIKTTTITEAHKTLLEEFVANLQYKDAKTSEARKWLSENAGKNTTTEIGGVSFECRMSEDFGLQIKVFLKENKR